MSNADQILSAMIEGTARGLATDKEVTEAEAVRKLRALAAGRADLLAEAAGVSLGFSGDDPTKWATRRAGELCIAARAEQDQLEHWIEVGRVRAEQAKAVPSTYNRRRHRP
jgi:citrate lyase beta subunit